MPQLPEKFVATLTAELGAEECQALCAALDTPATVAIRLHPDKPSTAADGARPIAWSDGGYYLDERPSFTTDPAFHAGAYYVQEPSSQFVGYLLRPIIERTPRLRLLDLCAAPGGKSTLYSSLVGCDGLVVANEINRQRAAVLADNVRKWGVGNVAVTNNDPAHFAGFEQWFDVVAVDAPCSGEGMFRKTPEARDEWNDGSAAMCADRQLKILQDIWPTLRADGTIIYSTCTFNRTEDEGLLERFSEWVGEDELEAAGEVVVGDDWGIVCSRIGVWQTFRFKPHRAEGEGFFAAIARKSSNAGGKSRNPKSRKTIFSAPDKKSVTELERWVKEPKQMKWTAINDTYYGYYASHADDMRVLAESMTVIHSGVCMGQIFKGKLKPEHSLAMFTGLNTSAIPTVEVSREMALDYLRRGDIGVTEQMVEGINLLCYEGLPLGWIKRVGNRSNNLYPNSLRILIF
ncbi:MAG: rRNA cytosine-C5-methylase [Rikenellaceae bacterium]|nr:rRNA cytosine-C5-methylase [Rikenellaceae bacterium]